MSMLKKTISLVILVSLVSLTLLPSIGCCDEWVKVEGNDNYTMYYQKSTVKIDEQTKIIKVWGKFVFTEKGKLIFIKDSDSIDKQKLIDMNHVLTFILFNYNDWKSSTNNITIYSKSGNVLDNSERPLKWRDIIPNSPIEPLFKQVLHDYNIKRNDWVYIFSNNDYTTYYNKSSIKIDKQSKIIKVWVKNVFTEKGKVEFLKNRSSIDKQKYNDIGYSLLAFLINYNDWKFTITHITHYSKSDNVLFDSEEKHNLMYIIPDSFGEKLINQILKDYNIQR